MSESIRPIALFAHDVAPRIKLSNYPAPFAQRMQGRIKRALGDVFGLTNFGVNLTRLNPGAVSSLRHAHSRQDEFIYVLQGHPTLRTDAGDTQLAPGMCAGFPAGRTNGHQLINAGDEACVYLEVGDRSDADRAIYPDDDIEAERKPDGTWGFAHKDGTPY